MLYLEDFVMLLKHGEDVDHAEFYCLPDVNLGSLDPLSFPCKVHNLLRASLKQDTAGG